MFSHGESDKGAPAGIPDRSSGKIPRTAAAVLRASRKHLILPLSEKSRPKNSWWIRRPVLLEVAERLYSANTLERLIVYCVAHFVSLSRVEGLQENSKWRRDHPNLVDLRGD